MGTSNCNHATCQGETCRREKPAPKVRKPIARRTQLPRQSTPIRQVSKGRAKENRQYTQARKRHLGAFPVCQAKLPGCKHDATEIHHMAGRIGAKLLDHEDFLAVCHSCHCWIETHPAEAKALGLSSSRLQVKEDGTQVLYTASAEYELVDPLTGLPLSAYTPEPTVFHEA